jgi:hypothetical protein
MIELKSKSDKRLIVEGTLNDKVAYFLVDSGASVGLIDDTKTKKYNLSVGRKYGGTLVGAGGTMYDVRCCNTFANIGGRIIPQFLIADIESVVSSIKRETGIEIVGIISLPQMKLAGMNIDANSDMIILE